MKLFLEILVIFFASVNLLITRFALIRLKQPTSMPPWLTKVFTSASSPLLLAFGLLLMLAALTMNSLAAFIIAACSVLLYLIHIIQTTKGPDTSTNLESCFGKAPESLIPPERRRSLFLRKRYVFTLPKSADPIFEQDIEFYTIPGTDRAMLCDMWQPPQYIKHSGLAFIYLHGSAWTFLDKDFGTRPFFRHLASQGHVIMDVAYRLFPEADFMGMVHDTKHAIAWMKANAFVYDINPQKIIIGGGSAGAHLALLAAYDSAGRLTPKDLNQVDLRVHGVISLYGQSDLVATYYHTCQHLTTNSSLSKQKKPGGMPSWIRKRMGKDFHRLGFDGNAEAGMLAPILGGTPEEKPEAYSLFSPITYVNKDCPATLIIHGKQDILAPVKAICQLHASLRKEDVPVMMHLLPQTDHGFDLILPKIAPSAHNAIYDLERFLAVMAMREPVVESKSAAASTWHLQQQG